MDVTQPLEIPRVADICISARYIQEFVIDLFQSVLTWRYLAHPSWSVGRDRLICRARSAATNANISLRHLSLLSNLIYP